VICVHDSTSFLLSHISTANVRFRTIWYCGWSDVADDSTLRMIWCRGWSDITDNLMSRITHVVSIVLFNACANTRRAHVRDCWLSDSRGWTLNISAECSRRRLVFTRTRYSMISDDCIYSSHSASYGIVIEELLNSGRWIQMNRKALTEMIWNAALWEAKFRETFLVSINPF